MPEGFTYVSSEPAGATFDQSTRTVSFALVGDTSFSYTVTAPSTAGTRTFEGLLRDSAKVDHQIGGASGVTVEVPGGPSPTRSFSPASVAPGGQVVVTIAVANYGGLGQIRDTLPEGFTYVSSEPAGATFDQSTRTVSFALVGDTSFSYTVTAPSTAGTPVPSKAF